MAAFEATPTVRLAFWDLIRRTFSVLKDRPLFFLGLTTIAVLPTSMLEWWGMEFTNEIVFSFLGTALTGIISYTVFQYLAGENNCVSLYQTQSHALSWPLVVIALILALISTLSLALVEWRYSLQGGVLTAILTELGLYGLHFFLFTICLAVIPACVVEDLGPLSSFWRSLELTHGHRTRIFFLLIGGNCLFALSTSLLILGLSTALFGEIFLPAAGVRPTTLAQFGVYLLSIIFTILVEAYLTTMYAIMYCDLRDIEDDILLRQLNKSNP